MNAIHVIIIYAVMMVSSYANEYNQYRLPIRKEFADAVHSIQKEHDYTLAEIIYGNTAMIPKYAKLAHVGEKQWVLEFTTTDMNAQSMMMWVVTIAHFDEDLKRVGHVKRDSNQIMTLLMKGIDDSKKDIERERKINEDLRIYRSNKYGS